MEDDGSYGSGYERGARRRKFAGYLRAANEMRQTYQKQYGLGSRNDGIDEYEDMPGAFTDIAVVREGDEELLLFPSYARRHHAIKRRPSEMPRADDDIQENQSTGDAEYWKRQWDQYEDENAVVEVDVRGWVYSPHKGQMTRKNRILVGIARQLSGVPAPTTGRPGSRTPSPHTLHGKLEAHNAKKEASVVQKEADSINRRGQDEVDVALRGGYSEVPTKERDRSSLHSSPNHSRPSSPDSSNPPNGLLPRQVTTTSLEDGSIKTGLNKRASWNQPSQMSPEELAVANANLMLRLAPFLRTPLIQTPLTVFFYNDDTSKSRTISTNDAGHFQLRALLDFVPTHLRVLASDKLSVTEEVRITEPSGVSLISDIDDTIKHSAIGSGAREIFRNAFIRDLEDLTVDGVKEWYSRMSELGVDLHYVSNAPWQLYPVLVEFFAKAGLPQGSFHLKQYTGMLQGIFEPVAERKKGTLERIMNDFPDRKFLLIGDSGEADLELYTDILLANPGRVLGVFIRDVTTTAPRGFFDSSSSRSATPRRVSPFRERPRESRNGLLENFQSSRKEPPPPPLPPRSSVRTVSSQSVPSKPEGPKTGVLIDFDEEPLPSSPSEPPNAVSSPPSATIPTKSPPPSLPSKPIYLRSNSGEHEQVTSSSKPANPVPRKPVPPLPPKPRQYMSPVESNVPNEPSPLSQVQTPSSHNQGQDLDSYRAAVRSKVSSAYNALPSLRSTNAPSTTLGVQTPAPRSDQSASAALDSRKNRPPPPIPPRRHISTLPVAAAQYATSQVRSNWNYYSTSPSSPNNALPNTSIRNSANNRSDTGDSTTANSGSDSHSYTYSSDPTISKKEELWIRRWARAKEIFEEKGVVLKSWRVGEDVQAEAVKLVEEYERKRRRKMGQGQGKGEKRE